MESSDGEDETIEPYKIRVSMSLAGRCIGVAGTGLMSCQVSSKYLELTRQKLQLTRLPHEILLPEERQWEHGVPKVELEPLVDYWYVLYGAFSSLHCSSLALVYGTLRLLHNRSWPTTTAVKA